MAKLKFNGPFGASLISFLTLNRIALRTYARHALGKRLEPSWNADIEIGIHFWRGQFTKAMRHADIVRGRQFYDSLRTDTDDVYDVTATPCATPKGSWYRAPTLQRDATILYFHGGGYTFNGPISARFAAMFAHHTKAAVFAPDYRLTPEHPHPAQAQDAFEAWQYVTSQTDPENVVVMGDSAGGHMALMLLQTLKAKDLPQPGLCIGICPWTDIGDRGASLHGNDPYDLVQGWMALQFGEWLNPKGTFTREELSPVAYSYAGLAPLYLQSGGREILRDMISDFAQDQHWNGANIMLDTWDDMPHVFQAYDSLKTSSRQALQRINAAIDAQIGQTTTLPPLPDVTRVS